MLKKIISVIYLLSVFVILVCIPMSAIFIICKLCQATTLTWIKCCMPLIISIGLSPMLIISKILIDNNGGK